MDAGQHWICAQMGAREHYAVPRALNKHHCLDRLFTDYWAGTGSRLLKKIISTRATRALAAKHHSEIPVNRVTSWNLDAIRWTRQLRHRSASGSSRERYLGYCEGGQHFTRAVVNELERCGPVPGNSVFFGYDTTSLEIMAYLREQNVYCLLDQIDPCRAEVEMVRKESLCWPGWQDQEIEVPQAFYDRHEAEWAMADRVIVNSAFSRSGLISQGVPADKIVVVPLAYVPHVRTRQVPVAEPLVFSIRRPLRLLYLGQVNLRKGIQYLIDAAKQLNPSLVTIDVVGPVDISDMAVQSAPDNLKFHGLVTVDRINQWYEQADVFVLPTLSDGFAITQLEAMAHGLPVVTTPNCGDVVTDAVDGFIVAPRNTEALTQAIEKYLAAPEMLVQQRRAALEKSTHFSLDGLFRSLSGIVESGTDRITVTS